MHMMITHIPTGIQYRDRKEAKKIMGHYNYNRELALHNFLFNDIDITEI